MTRRLILLLLLALGACAQPFEGRVAKRLHEAGIPQPLAQCMAHRWVDRLSVLQLRKIEGLSKDISERYRQRTLTVVEFVDQVSRLDDPEIVRVVSMSAARCALKV